MKKAPLHAGNTLRACGFILLLGALPLAGGLIGCAGDRYTQSTGERIDDKSIASRVRKALSADTQYKYDDVNVVSFKGVVQLSGFVNSMDQKNRAGELAKPVEGVKEIANKISVK